eukprot:81375-Pyramimonas_sp.AAC.1
MGRTGRGSKCRFYLSQSSSEGWLKSSTIASSRARHGHMPSVDFIVSASSPNERKLLSSLPRGLSLFPRGFLGAQARAQSQ